MCIQYTVYPWFQVWSSGCSEISGDWGSVWSKYREQWWTHSSPPGQQVSWIFSVTVVYFLLENVDYVTSVCDVKQDLIPWPWCNCDQLCEEWKSALLAFLLLLFPVSICVRACCTWSVCFCVYGCQYVCLSVVSLQWGHPKCDVGDSGSDVLNYNI